MSIIYNLVKPWRTERWLLRLPLCLIIAFFLPVLYKFVMYLHLSINISKSLWKWNSWFKVIQNNLSDWLMALCWSNKGIVTLLSGKYITESILLSGNFLMGTLVFFNLGPIFQIFNMSVLQHYRKGRTEKPFAHSVMLCVQGSWWQSHSSRGRKQWKL